MMQYRCICRQELDRALFAGADLFLAARQGGQKLYISAHSAAEPCDCQLEYLLTDKTVNPHEKHCHLS